MLRVECMICKEHFKNKIIKNQQTLFLIFFTFSSLTMTKPSIWEETDSIIKKIIVGKINEENKYFDDITN